MRTKKASEILVGDVLSDGVIVQSIEKVDGDIDHGAQVNGVHIVLSVKSLRPGDKRYFGVDSEVLMGCV